MADDGAITTEHVWDRIKDERVAMLVTIDGDKVEARPMAPHIDSENHRISFLTGDPSEKTQEVKADSHVSIVFCDPSRGLYACVHGTGTVSKDRALLEKMWGPMAEAYFPEGIDGGRAAALVVTPTKAHVWEEASLAKQGWQVMTSLFSDKTPDLGRAGTVRM